MLITFFSSKTFGRISRRGLDCAKYVQRHLVLDFLISMTVSHFQALVGWVGEKRRKAVEKRAQKDS